MEGCAMTIPALEAAKYLCKKSGWSLSNLSLQKILYLAHMIYMGRHEGRGLINGRFEAWDYGPVQPAVYHRAKTFGSKPVGNIFHQVGDIPVDENALFLDLCLAHFGQMSPGSLVEMTHGKHGAWYKHYQPGKHGVRIPEEDMLLEYKALMNE